MDNCINCHSTVTQRQEGLFCDGPCDRWQHRRCDTGIDRQTYRQAVKGIFTILFTQILEITKDKIINGEIIKNIDVYIFICSITSNPGLYLGIEYKFCSYKCSRLIEITWRCKDCSQAQPKPEQQPDPRIR